MSRPVDEEETFADVLYESRTDNGPPDDGTDDDGDGEKRRYDPVLRAYVPTDGNWPVPKRKGHIRSSEGRGRAIPCGLDPRVPDDDCDSEDEEGGDDVDA